MSGKKELTTPCPECGRRPLSVLTRRERAKGWENPPLEVPIDSPICPVGHIYRMEPGEAYPD